MILHLVDDEKFTDDTIDLFERVDPGNHLYVLICNDIPSDLKFIKKRERILLLKKHSDEYFKYFSDMSVYDALIVYSFFNVNHLDIVLHSPANIKIVWLFGGGELFSAGLDKTKILLPLTQGLYYKNAVLPWLKINVKKYSALFKTGQFAALLKPFLKPRYSSATRGGCFSADKLEKAIQRINYIAPVIEDDFDRIKKIIPCQAQMVDWNYPADLSLEQLRSKKIHANNWLVGNAARYANNHLEIFIRLRKLKGHTGKLIVPLSYGGDALYQKDVLDAGRRWFGERFCPMMDYMPLDQYFGLLGSCSAAFFNFRRQHAMGNTLVLLYLGVKVYLREENPIYQFLKRRQAVVFSLSADWPKSATQVNIPLEPDCVEINRSVVASIAEKSVFEAKTRKLVTLITTIKKDSED